MGKSICLKEGCDMAAWHTRDSDYCKAHTLEHYGIESKKLNNSPTKKDYEIQGHKDFIKKAALIIRVARKKFKHKATCNCDGCTWLQDYENRYVSSDLENVGEKQQ